MNWLAIVLIVLFVAFTWLRLDTERRAAQQREEERP